MAVPPSGASNAKQVEHAKAVAKSNPSEAEAIYKEVLSKGPGSGEAALRDYETALLGLGELYRDTEKPNELGELLKTSRSTLSSFAKAKTAKLGKQRYGHLSPSTANGQSPTTPRLLRSDPQYTRPSNHRHEIMHRMGCVRTTILPPPEPRDQTGVHLHAEAVIL